MDQFIVYRSTLYSLLREIDEMEAAGKRVLNLPIQQKMDLYIRLVVALQPWLGQLLPARDRARMSAHLMRLFSHLSPEWTPPCTQFLLNQIGRSGIEEWVEINAPLWVVSSDDCRGCTVRIARQHPTVSHSFAKLVEVQNRGRVAVEN